MVSDAWMEAQNEASESSLHLSSGDTCLLGGWLGGTCIRDCKDSVHFSREDAAAADMANPRALAAMAYVAISKTSTCNPTYLLNYFLQVIVVQCGPGQC